MPRKTRKLLAVIGDPIAHSLSPLIQNAAIRKLKIPYEYRAIRIKVGKMKEFMKTKARKLEGFNVTIPHKEAIIPLLDRLAFEAKLIGAVNTVVHRGGEWIGFNTDGSGYLMSLEKDRRFDPKGLSGTILGAGGAARAIAFVLGLRGVRSLTIANRTLSRGKKLTEDLRKHLPKVRIQFSALVGREFEKALSHSHFLINTTSVGMGGTDFGDFPWNSLKKGALVSDIVYRPHLTPFLKAARKAGHPIHTGEGMLIYQGALALEMWTGKFPDVKLMRWVMLAQLKKDEKKKRPSALGGRP